MTNDDKVKENSRTPSTLIERSQNKEGGWRYQPVPYDADISVTICQIMALRAARDAGIKVEKEVIDKAVEYVKRCQNPDGGFSYVAGQGAGSGFARSGAGVASLYYAGIFEGDSLKKGLDYSSNSPPEKAPAPNRRPLLYGNYYTVQAMFLAGGDYWATWYPPSATSSSPPIPPGKLVRRRQRRLRHLPRPDHPPNAQPLPPRLQRKRPGKLTELQPWSGEALC